MEGNHRKARMYNRAFYFWFHNNIHLRFLDSNFIENEHN